MNRIGAVLGGGLLLGSLLAGVAGCGVPTGGRPEALPSAALPSDLVSPRPAGPVVTSPPPRSEQPRIFLVTRDETLVPRGRDLSGGTPRARLENLMRDLATGPAPGERQLGLTTALAPTVGLAVPTLQNGVATVDITEQAQELSGTAGRRAVAQIVLTATSLPEVDAVLLTHGGAPLDAPLPSGRLTSDPLTAADYRDLVTAAPS